MRRLPLAPPPPALRAVCVIPLSLASCCWRTDGPIPRPPSRAPAPDGAGRARSPQVAEANQKLQDLGAQVQIEQESVNKRLVELQDARGTPRPRPSSRSTTASRRSGRVPTARSTTRRSGSTTYAIATYMKRPVATPCWPRPTPADALRTAVSTNETINLASQQVMTDLKRARGEQVNRESTARLAKQKADKAAADAQTSQDDAVTALTDAQATFGRQQEQINQLASSATTPSPPRPGQTRRARPARPPAPAGPRPRPGPAPAPPHRPAPAAGDWDAAPAVAHASQWDTHAAAMVPERVRLRRPDRHHQHDAGDHRQTSAEVTAELGRKFLQKIGILAPRHRRRAHRRHRSRGSTAGRPPSSSSSAA
jgi:hypothetical protein